MTSPPAASLRRSRLRPPHGLRRMVSALLLAGAVAGCGSSSSSSSSSSSATSTPAAATSSSTSSTASTGTSTVSSAPPVASSARAGSACGSAQLRIGLSRHGGGSGLGHTDVVLLFTNTGNSNCTLTGYAGVAGLNAGGAQVAQARRTPSGYLGGLAPGRTVPPRVTLIPGGSASAIVEGTDVPSGNATTCPELKGLLVTAPNSRRSVRVGAAPADCSGLQVHPVVAGATGTETS